MVIFTPKGQTDILKIATNEKKYSSLYMYMCSLYYDYFKLPSFFLGGGGVII